MVERLRPLGFDAFHIFVRYQALLLGNTPFHRTPPHAAAVVKRRVRRPPPGQRRPNGGIIQSNERSIPGYTFVVDGGGRLVPAHLPVPGLAGLTVAVQLACRVHGIAREPVLFRIAARHVDIGFQGYIQAARGVDVFNRSGGSRRGTVAGAFQFFPDRPARFNQRHFPVGQSSRSIPASLGILKSHLARHHKGPLHTPVIHARSFPFPAAQLGRDDLLVKDKLTGSGHAIT